MRSILVALIVFGSLPFIIKRPHIGIYMFSWISYMNPHRLTYGFAYNFPFAMIVGALTIASFVFSKEPKKLPITAATVLMMMVVFWISVTTLFAMNPSATSTWIDTMKVLVITLMTIVLMSDRNRVDILVWVIAGSIGFFAFKGGIFAILTGGAMTVWGPPDSRIEENNALGLATVMVLPLFNYLRMHAQNKWVRRGLMAAMPIMFISALASQSRGAFLAISMMTLFLWWKSKSKFAIGIGLFALAIGALSLMPPEYFERIETIQTYDEDQSAMSRINVWILCWRFALNNPLVGGGFDVLYLPEIWAQYSPNPNAPVQNAHSSYFELLAMHGFVGLGLFLMTCVVTFFSGNWVIARCKQREDLVWARDLSAMCQVSLIGFATGGAFLNLAFFDLFWHIVAIPIMVREIVAKQLANPVAAPVDPGPAVPSALPPGATQNTPIVRPGYIRSGPAAPSGFRATGPSANPAAGDNGHGPKKNFRKSKDAPETGPGRPDGKSESNRATPAKGPAPRKSFLRSAAEKDEKRGGGNSGRSFKRR